MLDLIRTAYQGDVVGQIYEGNQVFDVVTILDAASRKDIGKIADLPLRSPRGFYVLLKEIADIREVSGRYQIQHEGARRAQTVTVNVAGNGCPLLRSRGEGAHRCEGAAPVRNLRSVRRDGGGAVALAARPRFQFADGRRRLSFCCCRSSPATGVTCF